MAFIINNSNDTPYIKQNINLSDYAFYILSCDYSAFTNEQCPLNKIPSGFLNAIFQNYYNEAVATSSPSQFASIKGIHFNFRLQKETQQILENEYEIGCADKYYRSSSKSDSVPSVGKYLKAIFEEYSRLPYYQREKIYFKKTYRTISDAIQLSRKITYTYRGTFYELSPYEIALDEWSSYNYVLGFTSDNTAINCRLSYMENIKLSPQKINISKEHKKELSELLISNGVQFLHGKNIEIKVMLTQAGKDNYDHMVFMRPQYHELTRLDNGDYIYTFNCTERQAEYYFLKFGADAVILEPENLRKKFADKYMDACKKYM